MNRTPIKEAILHGNDTIKVSGWVHRVRKQGKILFVDLRDATGVLQLITGHWNQAILETMSQLTAETCVEVVGKVSMRPQNLINYEMPTGTIELQVESFEVLNAAQTLPFSVFEETSLVSEDLRLKYRYLDLRNERMANNILMRSKITSYIRSFFEKNYFVEIETPNLSAPTPEGARDFLVPTRRKGAFYALPQSPQQYKQLLMVAGIERYYQIARCFRDEASRSDRQPEFTQFDMEMSFVSQEEVMSLNEAAITGLVKTLYPDKVIQQTPFPVLTHAEAMSKYGIDRPDLRENPEDPNLLAFCWVVDFPMFERDESGGWTFSHNPFSRPIPAHIDRFMDGEDIDSIIASQYDLVLNGSELAGGSIRAHKAEWLAQTFALMGYTPERIEEQFGHMLESFRYGAPPHGGMAWGLDRLVMILQNEPNIREVMAFPKISGGFDPMFKAPSSVEASALQELGISIEPHS